VERFGDKIFLLCRQADPAWPVWRRIAYYAWRVGLLVCAGICMGVLVLGFGYGSYTWDLYLSYFQSWDLLWLNILPVLLLVLLGWGLLGRAWSGFLLGGGVCFGLGLAHYYKLTFRSDPLCLADMLLVREAGAMTSGDRYALFIDRRIAIVAGCLVLGGVLLRLLAPGKLKNGQGRLAAALLPIVLFAATMPTYLNDPLYNSLGSLEDFQELNRWNTTHVYITRGFLYPFLHSAKEMVNMPPEGYSANVAQDLLAQYEDADIPENRRISIIALMREAYVDFSRFDIPGLDGEGYTLYHQLEEESYTGRLVTNVFAGGTVDTERCFLTGDYRLHDFRVDTNSYVWYLREQGYTVEGCHPYYEWFYNRQNINEYLGFERYRFYEEDFETLCDPGIEYPHDSILLPEIYAGFQANKATGKPYFSFSVNVESHGPYDTSNNPDAGHLTGSYSDYCRSAMNNYLAAIWDTDEELVRLAEQLREDPEPVVLVTFGDHLPWMGDNNVYYKEMGLPLDLSKEEGFYNHYSTRYLIWANNAAREILGDDLIGEGPDLSPCYLMNQVFDLLGWEGPAFLQAMEDMREVFPVVTTTGRYVVDGALTTDIPARRQELFQQFEWMQYYWRTHFLYT